MNAQRQQTRRHADSAISKRRRTVIWLGMKLTTIVPTGLVLVCFLGTTPASSAPAQQVEVERQLQRHAAVGETVRLDGHVNYHPCGSVIPTTITVTKAPTHGTLSVRDEIVRSGHPELGPRERCAGYSGQGKVVYYTRTSLGSDSFIYESSSANGVVRIDAIVD
jgi:hypothetical protein